MGSVTAEEKERGVRVCVGMGCVAVIFTINHTTHYTLHTQATPTHTISHFNRDKGGARDEGMGECILRNRGKERIYRGKREHFMNFSKFISTLPSQQHICIISQYDTATRTQQHTNTHITISVGSKTKST